MKRHSAWISQEGGGLAGKSGGWRLAGKSGGWGVGG